MRRRLVRWLGVTALLAAGSTPLAAHAQSDVETLRRELETMKRQMEQLQDQLRRQEDTIRRLEQAPAAAAPAAPRAAPAPGAAGALDRALAEAEAAAPTAPGAGVVAQPFGGATLRLLEPSLDILFAAGTSTADDDEIALLQGGGHDPARRGFTLQQAELSLMGAVDPYVTGEAHIVFTPDVVELEEAFFNTTSLPYGLQLKGGFFLTEFGRLNPTHPHAWDWIDQPVINTRLLGPDGLRSPGVRAGWLAPVPWFSQVLLGAQNASGEAAVSFLGDTGGGGHDHGDADDEEATGIGGRPLLEHGVHDLGDLLYLTRWENAWDLSDSLSTKIGGSGLFGPNATGPHGRTTIYGGDLIVKWRPPANFRGWPFVVWQTEAMQRDYTANRFVDPVSRDALPGATLHDWGLYTQALVGFRYRWAAGLRYEYASGSGPSVGGRADDPLRDRRQRIAPLLVWHPSEFSRIRLQYDFDRARHLSRAAHSVWLGFEVLYGAHPAHAY